MHKIESIQSGEKNIGKFYCAGQGLNREPPGSYSSVPGGVRYDRKGFW